MIDTAAHTIIYYVWLTSDWAYFGGERLEQLARRHGVAIDYRPVRLPDVYARTGGQMLKDRPSQRQAYRVAELKRWRERLKMPVNIDAKYKAANEDLASCVVIAAKRKGLALGPLVNAYLRAVWVEERDIGDANTVSEVARNVGYDGNALLKMSQLPEIRAEYLGTTDRAVADGVFGSPFYIFNGEPFWGQDRLDFLEEAIIRAVQA